MGETELATTGARSARIFLSYRREDSSGYAGRLFDALVARFGDGSVFMDIDTIAPGQDFVQVIEEALVDCEIVLVLIGPNWLNIRDKRKRRRLENPDDFVRLEIEGALTRRLHVLPVLVGGAEVPSGRDLPSSLAPLARRHAFDLSDRRWHYDVQTLLGSLDAQSRPTAQPTAAAPTVIAPVRDQAQEATPTASRMPPSVTPAPANSEVAEQPAAAVLPPSPPSTDPVDTAHPVAADASDPVRATDAPPVEPVKTPVLTEARASSTAAPRQPSQSRSLPGRVREGEDTRARPIDSALPGSARRVRVFAGAVVVTALLCAGAVVLASRSGSPVTHASVGSPLNGVSCDAGGLCVAVDQKGDAITSSGTHAPMVWSATNVDGSNDVYDVSCPSNSLCVAVDYSGNVLASTNPTGGAPTWSATDVDGAKPLAGVSCATASLCVAVDRAGDVFTSTNPTGGSAAWRMDHVDGSTALFGVSCPTTALCVAVDQKGDVVTSAHPTNGPAAWSVAKVDTTELDAVSCLSGGLCVATDYAGGVVTSTNPAGGPKAWSVADADGSIALDGVSCATASLCVAVDQKGNAVTSTTPTAGASAWTVANVDGSNWLGDVSCTSTAHCVAVDQKGTLLSSTDPAGGKPAWSATTVNGS